MNLFTIERVILYIAIVIVGVGSKFNKFSSDQKCHRNRLTKWMLAVCTVSSNVLNKSQFLVKTQPESIRLGYMQFGQQKFQ